MRGGLFYYKIVRIHELNRQYHSAGWKRIIRIRVFLVLCVLYGLIHILTLSLHPFVHSDEAWLAVLSRAMIAEGTPAAVEEVFRLTPRYPHALKTLYHLIQIPFLSISWSAFSARLPSLIAGGFVLVLVTRIAEGAGIGKHVRFVPGALMALDPQFWYVSHLGRQEMILTALFLWSWSLKSRGYKPWIAALPLAAAVFVHPNAFIVAIPVGMMYLFDVFFSRKSRWSRCRDLFVFSSVLGAAAAAAVGFSYLMDADFFHHYTAFGAAVGTGDSILVKLIGLPRFFGKMWNGSSGTYLLADIRAMFVIGSLGFLITALRLSFPVSQNYRKTASAMLAVPVSLAAGMVMVGKYGPPSITFLMPSAYLLFAFAIFRQAAIQGPVAQRVGFHRVIKPAVVLLAAMVLSFSTAVELAGSIRWPSYASYRRFLNENIGDEGRVLVNLNAAFAFNYDRLVIWRDLDKLKMGDAQLESLIDEYDVRWIVLPDELEIIYNSRPVWNGIYGNPRWYPELMEILDRRGIHVDEKSFPNYAMRIVPFMNRSDWKLHIYRIEQ